MVFRVGIIGTNFGVRYHLPAYQIHDDFEVSSIVGRNYEKTKRIADDHGIGSFESWKELVRQSDIDIVSIATPPYLHYEMAEFALQHDKHILLEKPTALNANQAWELLSLVHQKGISGMIAHEWRYYYYNQFLYKLLHDSDKIGEIEMIRAQDLLPYAYGSKYSWQYDSDLGGGWVGIAGSHIVDLLRYLTGKEITHLFGSCGIRTPARFDQDNMEQRVTAEDYFSTIFTMDNIISGLIDHIPTLSPAPSSRLIISGSEGTIYTQGSNILIPEKIYWASHGSSYQELHPDINPHKLSNGDIGPIMHKIFQQLLEEFSKSINNRNFTGPTLLDGYRNQLVLDSIKQSSSEGVEIKINYKSGLGGLD